MAPDGPVSGGLDRVGNVGDLERVAAGITPGDWASAAALKCGDELVVFVVVDLQSLPDRAAAHPGVVAAPREHIVENTPRRDLVVHEIRDPRRPGQQAKPTAVERAPARSVGCKRRSPPASRCRLYEGATQRTPSVVRRRTPTPISLAYESLGQSVLTSESVESMTCRAIPLLPRVRPEFRPHIPPVPGRSHLINAERTASIPLAGPPRSSDTASGRGER